MLLDDIRIDVPGGARPALGGGVDEVHDVEGVGVLGLEHVELLAQEDVLLGEVAVDELELGLVVLVRERVG